MPYAFDVPQTVIEMAHALEKRGIPGDEALSIARAAKDAPLSECSAQDVFHHCAKEYDAKATKAREYANEQDQRATAIRAAYADLGWE